MIGDYVRAGEAPSKKNYLTVLGLLGLVGVVAIVGIVAHNHGKSTVENQALAGANPSKAEYEHLFRAWMKHFERKYADFDEYMKRFDIFIANYKMIDHHNSQGYSFTLGVNHLADLTREEFKQYYTGVKPATSSSNGKSHLPTDNLPDTVDWSAKGAVTAIKNQGQCGSCWAFSATGSLEGLNFIKNGTLKSFSEQQLVDCSGAEGNEGCNGGLPDDAFKYVEKYGIELESDYGYKAVDGTCKYNKSKVAFTISGYKDVPQENNLQLKAAVAQQPVSVGIEADQYAFQFYSGGVLTGSCGTSIDHGVLAVGYGADNGTKFWKVKNSWGESWGEEGYVRIERTESTSTGKCGIAMMASYPTA